MQGLFCERAGKSLCVMLAGGGNCIVCLSPKFPSRFDPRGLELLTIEDVTPNVPPEFMTEETRETEEPGSKM